MAYRMLWWFDAFIAALFAAFFLIGLADGSVSAFNLALWLGTLGLLGGVLLGGRALHRAGHPRLALSLLSVLAVPGALAGVFFLALIVLNPRWN